ncbi:MAG: Fic family protein [Cyclobacteriaceae bacterium]|nr:Fic family protein [Cyclobacteriaceae bacterium]
MKALHLTLRNLRATSGMVLREVASKTGIDAALISKFEKGTRTPTEANLEVISDVFGFSIHELRKLLMVEKIVEVVKYQPLALEVLQLAESRVEYLSGDDVFVLPEISDRINKKLKIIDESQKKWQNVRPLDAVQLGKMMDYFHVDYTFQSNRIEGNTLTLQETNLIVNEGLTIGGKSMREHLEAVNHTDAIDYMEQLVKENGVLNRRVVLELHHLILKGIDKNNAGRYRSVPVRITGSEHVPPQPYLLEKLMKDYFSYYEAHRKNMHPVILAAEMHERLVSIHPFIDGNGRTSRLIMNLILLQHGYTIANLKGDNVSRMRYYKALESVQVDNNPEPFYLLVADSVLDSLTNHLELAC